ncbi:hypothetical protein QT381_08495 [Galbitalea sp. SE-J8]|uniref:hypothetical protein n=1 Tax=Galbitalea sp. SE-J8 TaxID=3054952 RepID=UPI00259CB53F|nr:hypothetical protein [Galbitalea sp. SE-J8]MDM4763045.1 hypothetical protein [Galbitalea sp. SE-J8]
MTNTLIPAPSSADERRARFRPPLVLLAGFLVVSLAMEAVIIAQSALGASVDSAIWIRCSLVLVSSIVLLLLAMRAAGGSRSAWTRIRIVSVVVVVAIIVIVSIPGFLPDWIRVEQGVCGALVLPAAILLNLPRTRALFPKSGSASSDRATRG